MTKDIEAKAGEIADRLFNESIPMLKKNGVDVDDLMPGMIKALKSNYKKGAYEALKQCNTECVWIYDDDYSFGYDTSCDMTFCLVEDGPKENSYNFCPNCGGKIIEPPPQAEGGEDD